MKKGEESRQRLIECAAELFWKKWVFCYWNQRNPQTNRPSKMDLLIFISKARMTWQQR